MALHYDAELERFRDERGRFVSHQRGIRSSVARGEYYAAQQPDEEEEPEEEEPEEEGDSRFTPEQLEAFAFFDQSPDEPDDWGFDDWADYDDYLDLDYADDDLET